MCAAHAHAGTPTSSAENATTCTARPPFHKACEGCGEACEGCVMESLLAVPTQQQTAGPGVGKPAKAAAVEGWGGSDVESLRRLPTAREGCSGRGLGWGRAGAPWKACEGCVMESVRSLPCHATKQTAGPGVTKPAKAAAVEGETTWKACEGCQAATPHEGRGCFCCPAHGLGSGARIPAYGRKNMPFTRQAQASQSLQRLQQSI